MEEVGILLYLLLEVVVDIDGPEAFTCTLHNATICMSIMSGDRYLLKKLAAEIHRLLLIMSLRERYFS